MIAIFSCMMYSLLSICFSFKSNSENVVTRSVIELFDCLLYTSDANLMIMIIIRM